MTTSGTTTFALDFAEIIEESYERCGIEERTGYEARTARRSANLMMLEWANRGINLWTVTERTQVLTAEDGEYTLGTDVVDLMDYMIQLPNQPTTTRLNLTRVSVSTYAGRTNPALTGRPTEIYIDRQRDAPVVHLWPLPDANGPYTLVYWVLRRLQDAGAYTNTGDFPFRFLPAFVAGLAHHIADKNPQRVPLEERLRLQQNYEAVWKAAADEDREKAALMLVPRPAYNNSY